MKKLTKKTFEPNLLVKVHAKAYYFCNGFYFKLEAYPIQDEINLEITNSNIEPKIIDYDTILETHKLVTYRGSARCLFHIKGDKQLYQAFWINFAKKVNLI